MTTPSTTSESHTKHTPGPWRFEMENSYYKIYENKHDIRITTLNQEVTEDKANAHLISAAPELLEACKRVVLWLDDNGLTDDQSFGIRSAIAKAEGRS